MEEIKLDVDLLPEKEIKKKQRKIKIITRIVSIVLVFISAILIVISVVIRANERIEIINSSLKFEYVQTYGYNVTISGTLKNDTRKDYDRIHVVFLVYDEDDNYLGEAIALIDDLDAGEVCDFNTSYFMSTSQIFTKHAQKKPASYKIKNIETR